MPGATVDLHVTGQNLLPGMNAGVLNGNGTTVTSVQVLSEQNAVVTIAVASDAAPGNFSFLVLNPGTRPGALAIDGAVCGSCLVVD